MTSRRLRMDSFMTEVAGAKGELRVYGGRGGGQRRARRRRRALHRPRKTHPPEAPRVLARAPAGAALPPPDVLAKPRRARSSSRARRLDVHGRAQARKPPHRVLSESRPCGHGLLGVICPGVGAESRDPDKVGVRLTVRFAKNGPFTL